MGDGKPEDRSHIYRKIFRGDKDFSLCSCMYVIIQVFLFKGEFHFLQVDMEKRISSIIKRDGKKESYNEAKIQAAIFKAAKAVDGVDEDMARVLAYKVQAYILENGIGELEFADNSIEFYKVNIEDVQDSVEKVLIENQHARTAKAYILYRKKRSDVRDASGALMKLMKELTFTDSKNCETKRENANIDGNSTMGTMLKYGSEIAKDFNKKFLIREEHVKAYDEGIIHIHDMDFYALTLNCLQIDAGRLLDTGFNTGHGALRSPGSIGSAATLVCIIIQSNQNEMFGGQSIPTLDFSLAPYVALSYAKNILLYLDAQFDNDELTADVKSAIKTYTETHRHLINDEAREVLLHILADFSQKYGVEIDGEKALAFAYKKTDKDTYQAMEAMIHNLCTLNSRAGSQVPFSSLNTGMDISEEGRMVTKNLFLATEAGLGNGETPIFPISIFSMKKGVNRKGDPNYDLFRLACRCSAKRLFPNFNNIDASFNSMYYNGKPETICAVMGCRTRVLGNDYDPGKAITPGRGNLSFTTVNLPYLALLARAENPSLKGEALFEAFMETAKQYIELVFAQLLDRFEIQAKRTARNYPFLMGQGIYIGSENLRPDDEIREVIKHGTLSIGFIGLAECLIALFGRHHGEDAAINAQGMRIIKYFYDACKEETKRTGLNFSLIASPAEGCSGRLLRLTRDRFGVLEGITDRDYFTNSFHVPVYFPIRAWDKIQIEAGYHKYCLAGAISYIEVAEDLSPNIDAFEAIVTAMADADMGYFSINHPVDRDPVCGYVGIIGDTCPRCGRHDGEGLPLSVLKKVQGYSPDPKYARVHATIQEENDTLPNK